MTKLSRRTVLGGLSAAAVGSMLPHAYSAPVPADVKWDKEVNVLVAGGGAAGCMAALEAAKNNAKVLLVHASPVLGGTSAQSSGWVRSANTRWHEKKGVKDTAEAYKADILAYGKGTRDEKKAQVIAEESKTFVNLLMDVGVEFTDEEDVANGGNTFRVVKAHGYGGALMQKLGAAVEKNPNIEVLKQTRLTEVFLNDAKDAVVGAVIEQKGNKQYIKTPAVVIATGGFGRNQALIEKFTNSWAKSKRVMDPEAKGEGLKIATDLGAGVANLDIAMVCPTYEITKNIFYSTAPLFYGGVLLNEKGQRFTNECIIYTTANLDSLKQERVYEVVNPEMHTVVEKMIADGVTTKCDSYEDLAKVIGCSVDDLKAEIEDFNAITRMKPEERKDRFGRVPFDKELKPPFYVLQVQPVMMETVGGFTINEKSEITTLFGTPIAKGLYGAGSAAFGEHFGVGYRSGEALVYAGVTGLIAGRNAAALSK